MQLDWQNTTCSWKMMYRLQDLGDAMESTLELLTPRFAIVTSASTFAALSVLQRSNGIAHLFAMQEKQLPSGKPCYCWCSWNHFSGRWLRTSFPQFEDSWKSLKLSWLWKLRQCKNVARHFVQDYLAETSETRVTNFFVVADIRPLSTPIRFWVDGDLLRKLTGDAWVMAAFSKLGFIGKLFDSNRPGVQYHIAVVNLSGGYTWFPGFQSWRSSCSFIMQRWGGLRKIWWFLKKRCDFFENSGDLNLEVEPWSWGNCRKVSWDDWGVGSFFSVSSWQKSCPWRSTLQTPGMLQHGGLLRGSSHITSAIFVQNRKLVGSIHPF